MTLLQLALPLKMMMNDTIVIMMIMMIMIDDDDLELYDFWP